MIRFKEIERLASVSTAYVEERDLALLLDPEAPGHLANHDNECGSYFYVPDENSADDEEFEDRMKECDALGFSQCFQAIARAARREGIAYINFDRDGGELEGLEMLDHA
jgi:hypothetical protein